MLNRAQGTAMQRALTMAKAQLGDLPDDGEHNAEANRAKLHVTQTDFHAAVRMP